MEVEIKEDRKNPLLKRREVRFKAAFQGATPSRADVRGKLVAVLNSDKELTILDRLDADFGAQTATGYVKVYDDKGSMAIESDHKVKRNFPKPKEGEAAGQAAPAPAKEEAK